jgi:hypothetical protein
MDLAFPVDGDFDIGRQRVNGFDADAMEAAGNLVAGLIVELAAGMQNGIKPFRRCLSRSEH